MLMTIDYTEELRFAKQVAKRAKIIAIKHFRTDLKYKTKTDMSPVTVADEEINQMVITAVMERFPEDGVLGEEQSWQNHKQRLWICDPIDGTKSFSIGLPTFMFSLALVTNGVPIVSVVANPMSGELFYAIAGRGAFLNDTLIRVSEHRLKEAWMLYPATLNSLYKNQKIYECLSESTYQTNIVHGSVIKGTLIAQGLADGEIHLNTGHPWDFAAVSLLITEAGGRVTDTNGNGLLFDKELTNVVSSNGVIHDDLLDIVKANSVN